MIAVIAGSTGLVGSLLISKLLADKTITEVFSVSRKPLAINNPKLKEIIISDFSNLSDYRDQLCGDIYFCALGTTIKLAKSQENFKKIDYDAIVNFGKIAEFHHAESLIVISASGADTKSRIFYNKIKGETEKALKEMHLNRVVFMRPGLLIGERKENRAGEKFAINLVNLLSPILPSNIEKSIATNTETLATRMLDEALLKIPEIKTIEAIHI